MASSPIASAQGTADGLIYWANASGNTIGRANLSGTDVNENFIKGANGPSDVMVEGQYLYWANATGCTESGSCPGTIGRANLSGTSVNQSFISANTPYGLASNGQYLYWTNTGSNTIGRANLSGTDVNQDFITGLDQPDGVVVDGANIYWTNFGTNTIGEANLDGSDVNQSFISGANEPEGMAIDSQYLYWVNHGNGTIGRALLDGTDVEQGFIADAGAWPTRVAVNGENIYWTTWTTDAVPSPGSVGEANIDGTDVNNNLITVENSPVGVALSSGSVTEPTSATASVARARVVGRTASVNLGCHGSTGASCSVKLTLSIAETIRAGKIIAVSVDGNAVSKLAVLGVTSASLAVGQTKTVSLSLNGAGERLLSSHHDLRVKFLASAASQAFPAQTLTFRTS
jgi:uncharacterized protein YjbI with pentapeptide repeats